MFKIISACLLVIVLCEATSVYKVPKQEESYFLVEESPGSPDVNREILAKELTEAASPHARDKRSWFSWSLEHSEKDGLLARKNKLAQELTEADSPRGRDKRSWFSWSLEHSVNKPDILVSRKMKLAKQLAGADTLHTRDKRSWFSWSAEHGDQKPKF